MYVVPYWHSHKIYQGCVLFLKIARSKCLGKYTPNKTRAEPSLLWFIFPGTDSQRQWTSRTDGCARCTSYWSMVLPGMWLIPFLNYYFPFFFPLFFNWRDNLAISWVTSKYEGNSYKTQCTRTINKTSYTADPAPNTKQTWAESHFPVMRKKRQHNLEAGPSLEMLFTSAPLFSLLTAK